MANDMYADVMREILQERERERQRRMFSPLDRVMLKLAERVREHEHFGEPPVPQKVGG